MLYIGIDTGVHTGIAFWDSKEKAFSLVKTVKIHEAMQLVKQEVESRTQDDLRVIFEDARQRKWFGNAGIEKLQGAGSVKRDCGIWEDYLKSLGCKFEMIPPMRNCTKLDSKMFGAITKYKGKTSEHARDACMLVWDRK